MGPAWGGKVHFIRIYIVTTKALFIPTAIPPHPGASHPESQPTPAIYHPFARPPSPPKPSAKDSPRLDIKVSSFFKKSDSQRTSARPAIVPSADLLQGPSEVVEAGIRALTRWAGGVSPA